MIKISKRKFLLTIGLTVLVISGMYVSLLSVASAQETNLNDKTMAILNDVIGINTKDYAANSGSPIDKQYLTLPQKEVDIILTSGKGRLRVSSSFVNNCLRQIYLSDYEGELAMEKPAVTTADMAKGFLQRYRNYADDPFYGELELMLNGVDVSRNVTKTVGNVKLEVLNSDQTILDYVWTYTDENGITAKAKNVILSYDRGRLKVFLDNWNLYKVEGKPKISSEEATAIATEASKSFSYKVDIDNVTTTVTGFQISPKSLGHNKLSYLNFPNQSLARGGDPLTLYPSWYVPLGFDKSYPGAVTGMTVSIWADTSEVSIMGPLVVHLPSLDPTEKKASAIAAETTTAEDFNQESTSTMLSAPIPVVAMLTIVGVAFISAKKTRFAGGRRVFSKFWGISLCGVILLSVILLTATPAFADLHLPHSRSRIYAALNGGQGSPPQLPQEQDAAYWVSGEIESAFIYSGYDASPNQAGWGTVKSWILSSAYSDTQSYDRVAVFHFGHLADFQSGYVDNSGTPIWYTDIANQVVNRKNVFVFIWVCAQAEHHAWGTPAAWTRRGTNYPPELSSNGYASPDGLGQAYIGFTGASPIISAVYPTFWEQTVEPLKYFIKSFYDYAVRNTYSVNDALNRATLDWFGNTFTNSILNTGYTAWYDGQYWPGRMRVFGDGNLRIGQPRITLGTNIPYSPTFYLDGVPHSSGTTLNVWPWPRQYTINVNDVPYYTFNHFHYEPNGYPWDIYYKPVTISFEGPGPFTAYYSNPVQQSLTISYGSGGFTSPSGTQWYNPYTNAHVEAYADYGWEFDYWLINGYPAGTNPSIDIYMDGSYTLEAHFRPAGTGTRWLTVNAWDTYSQQEIYPTVYIDSQPYTAPVTIQVTGTWHSVAADDWYYPFYLTGFSDGYGNGEYRPTYYPETTITAYYDLGG